MGAAQCCPGSTSGGSSATPLGSSGLEGTDRGRLRLEQVVVEVMPRAVVGYGGWAVVVQTPRRPRREAGFFEELSPDNSGPSWPPMNSPRNSPRCSPREPMGFVEVGHSATSGSARRTEASFATDMEERQVDESWDSEDGQSPEPPDENSRCTHSSTIKDGGSSSQKSSPRGQRPWYEGLVARWPSVRPTTEPWTPPRQREEPWASALEVEFFDTSELPTDVRSSRTCLRI